MTVEEIFLIAVETVPAERSAYLDAACAGNAEFRAQVDALVRAHEEAGSVLEMPLFRTASTIDHPPSGEEPGGAVGPYTLVEPIGEGGMGSVWMARQTEPVKRLVAVKLIKVGMDSRQVLARFEAERQALALMDHPNIARVLDAGTTDAGRPYFVMELVKGVPITRYCDDHRLTPRQRLELFIPVCHAVQHAHQKGVIHRDLKPSNVLIATCDGRPVVKVIDFGVAKAAGQPLTEKTLFTGLAAVVGTPEYMSPEQAELNNRDVDTRSDVYSLGVLLYELLTGTTPLDRNRVKETGLLEVLRLVREEEPPKPSARVSSAAWLPAAAASRGLEPRKLRGQLRGEPDWIVMKALEKDRNRRYATAAAFAADVERHLNDEPVHAGPPSAWYRFRKLAQRNRRALATVSALALAALVGVGAVAVSTVLVWKANKELKEAVDRERREAYYQRITVAHRELSTDNLAAALRALGECPEDLRGWEWYYLMRLCKAEPLVIRAGAGVHGVAFSPDGESVAAACGDGTVKILNSKTGDVIRRIEEAHTDSAVSVAFHPHGRHIASAGADRQVKVWDLTTDPPRKVFTGRCDAIRKFGAAHAVAFGPDGRQLAAGCDEVVRVWDWTTDRPESPAHAFPGHENHSIPVALSRDGRHLATGGAFREGQKLWDLQAGGSLLRTFPAHGHPVSALAFSPDGGLLASASFDKSVKVWDTTTGELRHTLPHTGNVTTVAFNPDGRRLASAGLDKTVRVWDATTGREVLGLRGHTDLCGCVAFSPDGWRLASAGAEGTIRVWDATPLRGNEGQELFTFTRHGEEIRSVAFSPDGETIASAGLEPSVKLWNPTTGRPVVEFNTHAVCVFCLAWQPPDGRRIVTAGADLPLHTVKVWDAGTGREAVALQAGRATLAGAYHAAAFSPDGRYLVTGKLNGAVQVWDAGTGQPVGTLGTHDREIRGVVFSSDGRRLATASGDGKVRLWDVTRLDGEYLGEKPAHSHELDARVPGPTVNVAFNPDGRRLATGGEENTVKVWDVETGRQLRSRRGHNGEVYAVAFSPDGRWLASGGEDSTVRVWDSHNDYALVRTFRGHIGLVSSVAFSPDGRRLVSGSYDSTVKVWDASKLGDEPGR